ncbi:MAG: hypothetical protein U5L09_00735 [Bacteroidales bacterium]|nr:hypothetical protein [Bacteroidales bacterium]
MKFFTRIFASVLLMLMAAHPFAQDVRESEVPLDPKVVKGTLETD